MDDKTTPCSEEEIMAGLRAAKPARIRLIGLDLDKTALNSKREITPRVQRAIQNAIAAGIEVLPATGRALSAMPKAFMAIPGVRFVLCANGAKVHDVVKSEVFLADCFDKENALKLLDLCEEHGILPCVFIEGGVYSNPIDFEAVAKEHGQDKADYLK